MGDCPVVNGIVDVQVDVDVNVDVDVDEQKDGADPPAREPLDACRVLGLADGRTLERGWRR